MFHVNLKRMYILLHWGDVDQFPVDLDCGSVLQYPCWFFFGRSIFHSVVLKTPTMTVLSISFLKTSKIFIIYLGTPMLAANMFTRVILSCWITPSSIMKWSSLSLFMVSVLNSILSVISVVTQLSFHVCLLGFFFLTIPSILTCVDVLFWGGSFVDSIYVGHVFLSIQPPYVFWLDHLIHLHLN